MSATASRPPADSAILRARRSEDVVVGDEIVRHRLATRAIHWTVALFFFAAVLGALGLLLSGVVMWFPLEFPRIVRELAILIHDVTFILFVVAVVFHIYLGTAAEPGTLHSMIWGTVSKPWARLHHPRWYREVLGGESRRR